MRVDELSRSLGWKQFTRDRDSYPEIKAGFTGDLLSDVMKNAPEDAIWLTIQTHQNIVAVALVSTIPAIVICGGRVPDAETLIKAEAEGIVLLGSPRMLYQTTGEVYQLLGGR